MVSHGGLVVDFGDDAVELGAEGVVRGDVGETTGAQCWDVQGRPVGLAAKLVQGTGEGPVKRPGCRVGRNAGVAVGACDVAGPARSGDGTSRRQQQRAAEGRSENGDHALQ